MNESDIEVVRVVSVQDQGTQTDMMDIVKDSSEPLAMVLGISKKSVTNTITALEEELVTLDSIAEKRLILQAIPVAQRTTMDCILLEWANTEGDWMGKRQQELKTLIATAHGLINN